MPAGNRTARQRDSTIFSMVLRIPPMLWFPLVREMKLSHETNKFSSRDGFFHPTGRFFSAHETKSSVSRDKNTAFTAKFQSLSADFSDIPSRRSSVIGEMIVIRITFELITMSGHWKWILQTQFPSQQLCQQFILLINVL